MPFKAEFNSNTLNIQDDLVMTLSTFSLGGSNDQTINVLLMLESLSHCKKILQVNRQLLVQGCYRLVFEIPYTRNPNNLIPLITYIQDGIIMRPHMRQRCNS